jgi:histidinol-phosphate phosphatase family protein
MDAVIAAGGKGTRLGELTREIPKCLIEVAGRPLLSLQLEELSRSGIRKVWLLTGHLGEQVEGYVRNNEQPVEVEIIREEAPLGTGGGLASLAGRIEEPFVFLYGDLVLSLDLGRMRAFHDRSGAEVTMLGHPSSHPGDSDLILEGEGGRVLGISRKSRERGAWLRNLGNAGLYILPPDLPASIERDARRDFEKEVLPPYIETGSAFVYRTTEYVKDMGTPERLAEAGEAIGTGAAEARRLSNRQRAIFLDRDGTINEFVGLVSRPEQLRLIKGAAAAIRRINRSSYLCFVVSNQPAAARNLCDLADIETINRKMETLLGEEGAFIDDIRFCPHHPDKGYPEENPALKIECGCRKPKPGMLLELAERYNIDLGESYLIGDTSVDVMTAANAGTRSILVASGMKEEIPKFDARPGLRAADLGEAVGAILDERPVALS